MVKVLMVKVLTAVVLTATGWLLMAVPVSAMSLPFQSAGNQLQGYYQPATAGVQSRGVILFIHGDGAMPYDAYGYYPPLWDFLNQRGFATFSWDKPGVGNSSGNWLRQSMADRQQEVLDAIQALQNRFPQYADSKQRLGLFGFSQAGWVVPAVANRSNAVDFLIGVGFAINWQQQGAFLTRARLHKNGADLQQTRQALTLYQQTIALLGNVSSYAEYRQQWGQRPDPIAEARFGFIQRNYRADASNDFAALKQPALILLGSNDRQVDTQHTRRVLARLTRPGQVKTVSLANATHTLLQHNHFGNLTPGWRYWLQLQWQGKDAFAEQLFPQLDNWLKQP